MDDTKDDHGSQEPVALFVVPNTIAEIDRLARMDPIGYDLVREFHAKQLGIRVSTLDNVTKNRRKALGLDADTSQPVKALDDVEPWDLAVRGDELLTEIKRALKSHVVLADAAATAVSLWVLHAHAHDTSQISPILGITSPTPECGKTTLLTFLGAMVPRPLAASNITAAALFRAVEKWSPTLLVDEADTFLRGSDDLRGVLDSGHSKATAFVIRTIGENFEPYQFRTWSPKAIACIGKLHPTLASRALHIELKRKGVGEQVVRLRHDKVGHLVILARKAARWTNDNIEYLKSEPNMPAALDGRRGDNWRHLLAIADAARGSWPTVARKAAEVMVADDDNQFAGILLLQDIKAYFEQHKTDRVLSEVLAETLKEMLDRPWPEWKSGKPITQREIAKLLGTFDADGVAKIKTRDVRDGDKRAKGYLSEQFNDAFRRYLPSQSPVSPISSATPRQLGDSNDLEQAGTVTNRKNVTDKMTANRLKNNDCRGVADKKGESGNEEVCDRCGRPAKPGSPLVRVSVAGVDSFGHESCISPPEFPPTSPENQRLNS